MGEEKEKKKKKKKKEVKKEATPPPEVKETKKLRKKAPVKKRATAPKYSGALSMFNEKQLADFKAGFNYMDQDKDGIITLPDLVRCYDAVGLSADGSELNDMLAEASNPWTFTQMLTVFAEKMQGKVDDDDLIRASFGAFDEGDGSIDPITFENTMKGKGDMLTDKECKSIFPELPTVGEAGFFSVSGVLDMLIPKKADAEEEAAPPAPAPVEPAAEE